MQRQERNEEGKKKEGRAGKDRWKITKTDIPIFFFLLLASDVDVERRRTSKG